VLARLLLRVLLVSPLPMIDVGAQAPAATAASDSGLFERGQLTGDWGGVRSRWKNKGVEVASSVTQFDQGVASGGIRTGQQYNGMADAGLTFDLEKLAGWEFWSVELKAEMRFGGPLLGGVGSIGPVNTAVIVPAADGTVVAITTLSVTKLIPVHLKKGDLVAVSVGRFNLLDLLDEHFFAGGGIERFMNIAQIGPLTVLSEVPLITNAVNLAYVRHGEPFVTLSVMDPNDHSLDAGLSTLFADGVTFAPGLNFPAKYFGKTAQHTISGAITTKAQTPFEAIRALLIPGPAQRPVTPERGSRSVSYTFRQYIVQRAKKDGWGFFTQVSFANESTSPVTPFFDLGLGGNGLFTKRTTDEFGIAYAYTDLSTSLKDNLDLLPFGGRLRPEHQVEAFYNVHIAPWLQLSGDLQVIRPNRPAAETAIIPAARLRIVF
jgi:porin